MIHWLSKMLHDIMIKSKVHVDEPHFAAQGIENMNPIYFLPPKNEFFFYQIRPMDHDLIKFFKFQIHCFRCC